MLADQDGSGATAKCVCFTLRKSARTTGKLYDEALKPSGLKNTQFSLLGALSILGEITVGRLADEMAMDRTTLTRNLQVMVRDGFVENVAAEDARRRVVRLTTTGRSKLAEALPLWRGVQDQLLTSLGDDRWRRLSDDLSTVDAIARS